MAQMESGPAFLTVGSQRARASQSLTEVVEEVPEKNTFIDYPPIPMAQPRTPTASAPAFLDRFKKTLNLQHGQSEMGKSYKNTVTLQQSQPEVGQSTSCTDLRGNTDAVEDHEVEMHHGQDLSVLLPHRHDSEIVGQAPAEASQTLTSISEELQLREKNTFIDYPPVPMAELSPPTASAPAFLDRFKKPEALRPRGSQLGRLVISTGVQWGADTAEDFVSDVSRTADIAALPAPLQHGEEDGKAHEEALPVLTSISEELPESGLFIDYAPASIAWPRTPTLSDAPAFFDRFKISASSKAMQCDNCSNKFLQDANFCRKCGKPRPDGEVHRDISLDSSSSTECPSDSPATEEVSEEIFGLPSIGSAGHREWNCNPCAWFWKPAGCNSGQSCSYCHLCPAGTRKAMKKAKVAMVRRAAPASGQHEPAYVECDSTPLALTLMPSEGAKPLDPLDESSMHFAQTQEGRGTEVDPVKVSVKKTFIQFEATSSSQTTSEPPLNTAPGDFYRKMFQTMELKQAAPAMPGMHAFPPPVPALAVDSGLSLMHATAAMHHATAAMHAAAAGVMASASIQGMDVAVPMMNGKEAHGVGQCTPCAYFWYKKDGCRKGDECPFCHLCEKGEMKRRKKNRVQQLKAVGAYIPGYSKKLASIRSEAS